MATSELEQLLLFQLRAAKLPPPEQEFRFAPPRRWRFDFAWPVHMIAVEVEGGTWKQGRHTRGSGYESDCEKYNEAVVRGWRVLRFTKAMIESGIALKVIEQLLVSSNPVRLRSTR